MQKVKLILALLCFVGFGFSTGNTYPIAEPDLLEEIEKNIPQALEKLKESARRIREGIRDFRPDFLVTLPRAEKSKVYEVDLTYELEFDIPRVDERGRVIGVLYPKGFKFNPIKHIPGLPPELVIFNPKVEEEIRFVEKYLKEHSYVALLAVDTGIFELFERLKRPVYYFHRKMRDRLGIEATVSIVRWDKERGVAVVEVIGKDVLGKE